MGNTAASMVLHSVSMGKVLVFLNIVLLLTTSELYTLAETIIGVYLTVQHVAILHVCVKCVFVGAKCYSATHHAQRFAWCSSRFHCCSGSLGWLVHGGWLCIDPGEQQQGLGKVQAACQHS